MNISNILKKLSLGCGFASLCLSMQVSAGWGDNCCQPQCCPQPCCPQTQCCEDGPLSCSAFGVQIKGGVTPTWFTDEGNTVVYNPSLSPPIFEGGRTPKFDKIFDMPWQVGAELQWNASTHVQFFAEYVYENAKGKNHNFLVNTDLSTIRHRLKDFSTNAFYMGARYYFGNVWCSECGTSSIAPFVGFKGGVKWNDSTRFDSTLTIAGVDSDLGTHDYFRRQTLISAGAQMGLDYSINCNWGVVFTVECVGTQSLRSNRLALLEGLPTGAVGFPSAIGLGDTGPLLSVPVTMGVRYTF